MPECNPQRHTYQCGSRARVSWTKLGTGPGTPAIGRARPELGADIRSFVVNRYVLFYRSPIGAAGIELIRVLHGARDLDAVFSGDED